MSDTATTVALFAACASSLSASLAFIAVRMTVHVQKEHAKLTREFWRQSVQQSNENVKQWHSHKAAADSHMRFIKMLHLAFPDKFPAVDVDGAAPPEPSRHH
jgi:hypothetical protein